MLNIQYSILKVSDYMDEYSKLNIYYKIFNGPNSMPVTTLQAIDYQCTQFH